MKFLIKSLILFILFSFIKKEKKHVYEDSEIKCIYETRDGMLNGKYLSFYKTGIKKAEGNFKFNNRIGEWTLWDSTGKIQCKRIYENSLAFSQTIPQLFSISLTQKNEGCYNYAELKESNVLWETRLWRIISPKDNPVVFSNASLGDSLIKNILNNKIYLFDENFYKQIENREELKKLNYSYQLISIKIKEDVFADISRQLTETRIIGFYPVFKNNKDTIKPGWIFFPAIRKSLAKIAVEIKQMPLVKNIDDLFYFRCFSSEIEKGMNFRDQAISSLCKDMKECEKEKDRIETAIIESTHNILLYNKQ